MSLSAKLRRAPLRLASGAYILNSGVTKLGGDDEAAKHLQNTAAGAYPFLHKVQPKMFATGLGIAEIAVGGALLLPIVPPALAGAALIGVSGAMLNVYRRTAGDEGGARGTGERLAVAKDVTFLGIGLGLVADAAFEPAHDKVLEFEASAAQKRQDRSRLARRKAKRAARKANAEYVKHLRETAHELQAGASKRAAKAADQARELAAEYGPVAAEKARAARDVARDFAGEYGPVAAEKAHAAQHAAREFADEYRPVAEKQAKRARKQARKYASKARDATADARERIAG
jgi:uncharacterized membrane protein YphA (DoxX/SURF4 family)